MKLRRFSMFLILVLSLLVVLEINAMTIVSAEGTTESDMFIEGVGNYFEINSSPYLNVTLASTETVHVLLESIPGLISVLIESNSSATSTILDFGGFEPDTTYYRHQDGDFIENFTTDTSGGYSYTQDVSQGHHIYIQENTSTLYIDSNYTFTHDIYDTIVVTADNIVIDGNGYALQGSGGGYGFYMLGRSGVTIKNTVIKGWSVGIGMGGTVYGDNVISNNFISQNQNGIGVGWTQIVGNTIKDNIIISNWFFGIVFHSMGNLVFHNDIIDNTNQIFPNPYNDWYNTILLEGNYWSDYPGLDDGSGTGKHSIAGDGIGDTDIPWPEPDYDYYPYVHSLWFDNTPPEITIITPEPYGLYTVGMALDFYATDAESGVATIMGQLTNTTGDCQEVDTGFPPTTGVYTLVVVATDNAGNTAESDPVFFVVYDPEGGFATGGGWIYPDEASTLPGGKANFGFVAKYKRGSSTGNLEFQYQDAEINLKSTTIDWLVISGVSAQFQGTGTINGEGVYTFRVMARDKGEPGVGTDEFDIKIWEGIDTEVGPIHNAKNIIAGGNIVVHKK